MATKRSKDGAIATLYMTCRVLRLLRRPPDLTVVLGDKCGEQRRTGGKINLPSRRRRSNKNQLFGEIIARSQNENSKQTKQMPDE